MTLIRVDSHSVYICNREIIWSEADQGCIFLFVNLVVLPGFLVSLLLLQIQLLCDLFCMKLSLSTSSRILASLPNISTSQSAAIPSPTYSRPWLELFDIVSLAAFFIMKAESVALSSHCALLHILLQRPRNSSHQLLHHPYARK